MLDTGAAHECEDVVLVEKLIQSNGKVDYSHVSGPRVLVTDASACGAGCDGVIVLGGSRAASVSSAAEPHEVQKSRVLPVSAVKSGEQGDGVRSDISCVSHITEVEEECRAEVEKGEYGHSETNEEQSEEEGEEEEEEEEEEEDYEFVPPADDSVANAKKGLTIVINKRTYTSSSFVHNRGFLAMKEMPRHEHKSTDLCSSTTPHDIINCKKLHLSCRAVRLKDCYVRLNMLVSNQAKEKLLTNPMSAAHVSLCEERAAGHDPTTCACLHLVSGIVFVGAPSLRVGYFEAELHPNIALKRLQDGADSCGTWCRAKRSHMVVTCRFVHYNRGAVHKEISRPPDLPLAVFPALRPRAEGRRVRGVASSHCGGRGQGRGRGRGRERGRGRGRGAAVSHHRGVGRSRGCGSRGVGGSATHGEKDGDAEEQPVQYVCEEELGVPAAGARAGVSAAPQQPSAVRTTGRSLQVRRIQFLNIILALLSIITAILLYMLM
uniref:Uncharacterized protein TCIL3000_3_2210 n=1 Tax=Trypanosoma congolense (strain IL3000) TaxID=1068625 RepID=G0UK84_TRYCI|nr:unnamed protein product [Trypanosoma congolense IL3000]